MDLVDYDFITELNELRRSKVFCDAVITIPEEINVRFPIHRVVLASCSQYFRSLFKYGNDETNKEISISGVSSKTMKQIIEYGYLRTADINEDNFEDLFAAADRFHIFGLLKECTEFLLQQLCVENCLGILKFARFYSCEVLKMKALKYVLSYLGEIVKNSQEFVVMDIFELKDILEDDELLVKDESEVYLAIQRWVDFSYVSRRNQYETLFQAVRLAFCKREFITNVIEKNKTIRKSKKSMAAIEKAKQFLDLQETTKTIVVSLDDPLLRPRVPSSVIFTIGGWSSEGVVNTVETYDKNVDHWYSIVPPMNSKRSYHGTVNLNNLIYVIGGFDSLRYLNSVLCFDPNKRAWQEKGPMHLARCYVSTCAVEDFIYACGGFDGRQRHNSVERYDYKRNQWSLVQPMWHNRSDAGTACYENKLYVVGGFDGLTCLDSTEVYNPLTDQWTLLEKMNIPRSGVALIAFNHFLIALGGYDGGSRLATAEQYDFRRQAWGDFENMHVGRSNFAAAVLDGQIYVIGGYDGATTSDAVEVYDPDDNMWRRVKGLIAGRSAVSACVLLNEGTLRDYTFYGAHSLSSLDDS
ncbi:kelch-like protein 10 [Mytilus edulis]|uniref:KLHL10 n=1 Tax=Mytilus edulis TaxID=6550 RepID=A0A8S3Q3E2_MYTED|nr:KLHL10 [Mytilus edulis]